MTSTMNKPQTDQDEQVFSGIFLFSGIVLIVLGVIAAAIAVLTTIGSVIVFGAILLAAGIAECIHAFRARRRQGIGLNVLSAILYLVVGGLLLSNPLAGALTLTLIMSIFLFMAGIFRLAYGVTHRAERHRGWFLFGGLIDIALGVLIALGWPATALWVIGFFVGIEMVLYGCASIATSLALKDLEMSINSIRL